MAAQPRFTNAQLREKLKQKIQSCSKRNIPFLLSMTEYEKLLKTKRCYYTGVLMNGTPNTPHFVSIDRIDPDLPYVTGNVVACSHVANAAKNALFENPHILKCSFKEVMALVTKLEEMDFKPRPKE